MKSLTFFTKPTSLLILISATMISACTLGDINTDVPNTQLTEQELNEAGQILGQAIANDNDGLFGSIGDAIANVSESGIGTDSGRLKSDDDDDDYSGRGGERNYSYSYDPDTGIHTIQFNRTVTKPNFSKELNALLTYKFTDAEGGFIAAPRMNRDRIENIDYTSNRDGSVSSLYKNSEFIRIDTFSVTGVSDANPVLGIEGKHESSGDFNGVRKNGDTFEKNYVVEFEILDVQIEKDSVAANGNLSSGVTGTINYEMSFYKNRNGDSSTKTVSGTIEMDGDGSALLKFARFAKIFKVNLKSGFVTDDDDSDESEKEAEVISVDVENSTVTLANDLTVILTDRTEIKGEEGLETLQQVADALAAGTRVEAEVEGYRNPDDRSQIIAEEIEFELFDGEGDDGDDGDDD
ncbi:hypothetical protein AB2B38_000020 [Balneola sp. MJW-20]|uniref:hypothetical protein n=1 Tax=Gracilimonas aurantiaca TaxID=3234185 RepID=UPI003467C082